MLTTNKIVRMDELMRRRWKALFLMIIILLAVTSTGKAIEQRSIIQVDPTFNIQNIINTASPNTIILFLPGTYNQTFHIRKQMTLTSQDPIHTFINVTTKQNKPAITISSSFVHLSNMTIQNNGPGFYTTGIRVLDDNVTIKNCLFKHTPIGISIWSNNNTINNNTFLNCSDEGIVLLTTTYSTANRNIISHCIFKENCDAIELQQSCYNLIENCIMINNTHSGIDAIISNNDHNIVLNCTISNNNVHGIYFTKSKENKIIDCLISNNSDGNIVIPNSENITIITYQEKLPSSSETNEMILIHTPIESNEKTNVEKTPIISILMNIVIKVHTFIQNH